MQIIPLTDPLATSVAVCGGKAAKLAELIKAGMPSPQGAVVTVEAFRAFLSVNHLERRVADLAGQADRHSASVLAETVRALIQEGPIPQPLYSEMLRILPMHTGATFAIRSSAAVEDSQENSWAGQFATYLNVPRSDIPDYVRNCWASLFSPRALWYARTTGISLVESGMAVVIQPLIVADAAGIAFTKHPVTQDASGVVIEVGLGLGEAIVSGLITPDSFVVDKVSLRVIERSIARQKTMCVPKGASGTAMIEVDPTKQRKPKASDDLLVHLAKLCVMLETHFGSPQDVEFCIKDGQVYILQSRPITT